MKGPGIRLDLDVRRHWECPECGKQRREIGATVATRCRCTSDGSNMKLMERQRLTRSFADVIERVQQASSAKETQQSKRQTDPNEQQPPPVDNTIDESTNPQSDDAVTKNDTEAPPDTV